jgi:hypothetical protein
VLPAVSKIHVNAGSSPRVFALACASDHKCVHEHSSPRASPRGTLLEPLSELEEQGWSDYQPHTQAQNLDETGRRAAKSTRPSQVCSSHDLSTLPLPHALILSHTYLSLVLLLSGHRFIQSVVDLRVQTPTNITDTCAHPPTQVPALRLADLSPAHIVTEETQKEVDMAGRFKIEAVSVAQRKPTQEKQSSLSVNEVGFPAVSSSSSLLGVLPVGDNAHTHECACVLMHMSVLHACAYV